MSDVKEYKAQITRPCRINGIGCAKGDVVTLRENDFFMLCGIGKARLYDEKRIKEEENAAKEAEKEAKKAEEEALKKLKGGIKAK